jgi:hypothetical protein
MTTGGTAAGGEVVRLLIVLTGIVAVMAGPLFRDGSSAWAQLDASRPQSAFRLVGTIEGGPFTGAVIDDTKNPQAFYRLNEKLPDESQLVKVQHNYIVLKWPDGTKRELYTAPGTGGGNTSAATTAAPYVAPRPVDQPTPERSVEPEKRPVQDQSNRKGVSRGRRTRPSSTDDN